MITARPAAPLTAAEPARSTRPARGADRRGRGASPAGRGLAAAWVLAALLTVAIAGPVVLILWRAIAGAGGLRLTAAQLESYGIASLHSLALGAAVVAASTVLALPLAVAVERTAIGRMRGIDIVCLVPFMTPPYLASMGWILFFQPNGYLQQLLPFTAVLQPLFFSFAGLVLIMSLHLFPLIYLAARQAMASISGRVDEAAQVHGMAAPQRLWRIWMPPLLRAALAAGVLVFVKTVGEFGTPVVFGSLIHFRLLTTQIYEHISSWPISFAAASQLALVLLAASCVAWSLNDAHQRRHRYPLVSGRSTVSRAGGPSLALAAGYAVLLLAAAVGVPYGVIATTSLLRVLGDGATWANLTLSHYAALLHGGSQAAAAVGTSLWLAVAAATVAWLLGTLAAAAIHFAPRRLGGYIDFVVLLPNTIPDILVVIGLILFWNAPWLPWTVYDTPWILVVSFVVLFLPYTATYARQAMARLSPSIWEAGVLHGGHRLRVAARIMAPLLLPSMLAGWMFVFAISFRDLVAPMLISPPNLVTASTYIFGQYSQGALPDAMAMAVITIALSVGVLSLAQGRLQRSG